MAGSTRHASPPIFWGINATFARKRERDREEMDVVILDRDLEELLQTRKNKRYRKIERSKMLFDGLERAIRLMRGAKNVDRLHEYSFLHYERLKHSAYRGKSSIRIANGSIERLIFTEHEDGIEVHIIELDDTHYGNKR